MGFNDTDFLNGEMKKENIEMVDNGGTPDTPNKREQLELEVNTC